MTGSALFEASIPALLAVVWMTLAVWLRWKPLWLCWFGAYWFILGMLCLLVPDRGSRQLWPWHALIAFFLAGIAWNAWLREAGKAAVQTVPEGTPLNSPE